MQANAYGNPFLLLKQVWKVISIKWAANSSSKSLLEAQNVQGMCKILCLG